MSRSSLTLLFAFAVATTILTLASAEDRTWPTVEKAPTCAVDANYPLRIVLSDEPAGFGVIPGADTSITYEILAARQFESAEVELFPSAGVQILGGMGAYDRESLGILKRGETRSLTMTARLEPGQSRGTVEVRLIGWTEGLPLQTATVWNILSGEQAQLRSSRAGITAEGRRVQEHPARKRVSR